MASSSPRTVEEIFKDYSARRSGLVRALTYDVDDFYSQCDPDKENLCLYGFPNEAWEVALPAEEVPPELPEPALVSFYFGARLNRNERKRLFSMINDLPTVFEVVTGRIPIKDKPTVESGSKSRNSTKRSIDGQPRSNPKLANENYEEDEEEQGDTFCGSCGGGYNSDEFWIGCDNCERWYHGKCVKITPAKAELIKFYKCPSCTKKLHLSSLYSYNLFSSLCSLYLTLLLGLVGDVLWFKK
ncbi:hypothetical protein V6N12_026915 [Hibiscus sabdariffa]|uniref:PHD finger protein ALFIN-LIKE n=1 Tax=Hibiscus sabdariffa TaxID=183260 RepID=A0ABR2DT56_9ROSI